MKGSVVAPPTTVLHKGELVIKGSVKYPMYKLDLELELPIHDLDGGEIGRVTHMWVGKGDGRVHLIGRIYEQHRVRMQAYFENENGKRKILTLGLAASQNPNQTQVTYGPISIDIIE